MKLHRITFPLLASSGAVAFPSILQPRLFQPVIRALDSALGDNDWFQAALGSLQGIIGRTEQFEYVIVGAGTAGNAVAYRLAEAGKKVAVVEAGAYYEFSKPVLSTIPGLDILWIGSSQLESLGPADWGFMTAPQAGANNRRMHFAQGKAVGGSSVLNFMLYHRPPKGTLDQWAEMVDDDSYRYECCDYPSMYYFLPRCDEIGLY